MLAIIRNHMMGVLLIQDAAKITMHHHSHSNRSYIKPAQIIVCRHFKIKQHIILLSNIIQVQQLLRMLIYWMS